MEIKEIELGGVFNLDKYENVRVSLRVTVNSGEDIGKVFDQLGELVEKLGLIQRVIRRWKDLREEIRRDIKHFLREADKEREWARRAEENARREAEEALRNLNLDVLSEEARKLVEKDPVNVFKLGLVSTKCMFLDEAKKHLKEAEGYENRARELEKKLEELTKTYREMKEKLWQGKLSEAAEIATKLWEEYKQHTNTPDYY